MMVSEELMESVTFDCLRTAKEDRHTRESGYPVRRGLSDRTEVAVEYWIIRFRG
jgi:hypothetical protein